VIAQHMPAHFTEALARRLDSGCRVSVSEARDGERILPGHVLIAPGDRHTTIRAVARGYEASVMDGPRVNRHRPSVDVLFRSVACEAGQRGIGVLLTGMGDDGAAGLLEMHQAGATTLVQDKATSVVFGMPAAALKIGAADEALPIGGIAGRLMSAVLES
jgi:two-component system chemotaxis response regulator CheB